MSDLEKEQRILQTQADDIVRDLNLEELLRAIGTPVRVGSSAMGLMVRRDIDITTICSKLDAPTLAALSGIAATLMQNSMVVESVRFRNDTGAWNKEPERYPDGLYLGVTARAQNTERWTIDLWVVDQPDRQPDLAHLTTLLPRMTNEHRRAILEIKYALARRPERSPSALVYEAVMDNGIRTAEQFDDWYRARAS